MGGIAGLLGLKLRPSWKTAFFTAAAGGLYLGSHRPSYSFQRKAVYITGGSRGLGLSLAWNFLKRGADVALIARDNEELVNAHRILTKAFPNAKILLGKADVTKPSQLENSFQIATDYFNGIDIVVNNAGAILVAPFASMEREDFEAQMELHLYSAIALTRLAAEHFKTRGGGRVLNVCSVGGKMGVPHMSGYNASKFALAGFAQSVQAELAVDNIFVTTAYPTLMRTGSPIQAVFKGDHKKEFTIFETLDNLPGLAMSADRAASQMLDALAQDRTEVVLSPPAKFRVAMGAIFPETMHAIMSWAAGLLPKDTSRERKTGGEIAARDVLTKVEKMYNQTPHRNAEFNLGVSSGV